MFFIWFAFLLPFKLKANSPYITPFVLDSVQQHGLTVQKSSAERKGLHVHELRHVVKVPCKGSKFLHHSGSLSSQQELMKHLTSIYLTEDSSKMYIIPLCYLSLSKQVYSCSYIKYLSSGKDYESAALFWIH